jgi:hypothetical protein
MRNRAKCKLCNDIIESKHNHDMVSCSCGQISIDGGDEYFRCLAIDWDNFIRIADDGSEIPVKIQDSPDKQDKQKDKDTMEDKRASREELLQHLKDHIAHTETLPPHVRQSFCTYMDLDAAISLIYAILVTKD